ncbi:hypothetical protein EDI28_04855 [Photobacterium chitinilyticum]|uniref:Uncharacterized protein n=3 Tax=Photobacterium chitinilyticum TaxID=2485123 RepID=A0A3S4TQ09_9GAMM|nr:hypothetical protein EDI28_04855 [Photobacterium chitinilyticum]
MIKHLIPKLFLAAITSSVGIMNSVAEEDVDALIARAKSAAPAEISDNATVVANGRVLSKGTNSWICLPNTFPNDGMPMCNDPVWMEMLDAMVNKKDFKADRIGISYMLQGDIGAGVSNSDPYHSDPKKADDYVEMGAHLMIIVPEEMLKGLTDDPSAGGPYIMWKDTPYRHIMVPISSKALK